jgi:signal transduction histidine kinase
MKKLWPRGITSRITLIILLVLFAAQAFSIVYYVRERAVATELILTHSVVQRIGTIVRLLETTPTDRQPEIIAAVNSPTLWVDVTRRTPPPMPADGPRGRDHLMTLVQQGLEALGGRQIRIAFIDDFRDWDDDDAKDDRRTWRNPDDHRFWGHWPNPLRERFMTRHAQPDLLPSRRKAAISVQQRDGTWINFTVSSDRTSLRWAGRMGFWILITGLFILVFSIWAARRVTKPLKQFAEAADRLGVDVHAPPMEEKGSGELRQATRAFNRMQQRIRRFVDDRTLMLAAISHDLRTALTRLRLRAEFIEDEEQQRKAIGDLDEMQTMLDETLSFAREDAGLEVRSKVDVTSMLESICDDLTDAGARAAFENGGRVTYRCQPVAMRRALTNLVHNAVKYGGEAAVTLAGSAGEITVTVADRGPGIAEELRERVFTPFFRIEGSRNRATGGTGLGLAVARSIIRRHGGDITLHDREGGGLLVKVSLPKAEEI